MSDGRNQVAEKEALLDDALSKVFVQTIDIGRLEKQIQDLQTDNERLRAERNEVYKDAAQLACLLHAEHWPENTGWSPLGDTRGVLTQISNMCVLMRDQKAEIERLRAALEGKE